MKHINGRIAAVVGGAVVLAALSGTSGAFASRLITSGDIRDGAVHRVDLSDGVNNALDKHAKDGKQGPKGEQGPKGDPGLANVIAGAGYTNTWKGDGGTTLQTARGECPAGSYALGGGFSTWGGDKDLGGDNKNIQVTVSAPYFEGDYVAVDEGGDFRPTEWVIKGYNNGTTDQIVRPWVVCANAAD